MNRSVLIYAGLLVVGLGASWAHYTGDHTAPKEGVMVVDVKKDDLGSITYDSPDVDVLFEMREDALGRYGWVTVTEQKKKKVDGVETTETKVSKFKAGSAADKLIEGSAPLLALRALTDVDDAKLESFGLKTADTTVTYQSRGRSSTFTLGGETYGTKDRYAREEGTGRVYVLDDELFKPLKFAVSRLPERSLVSPKPEAIESVSVTLGGTVVMWTQANKDDRAAAYWNRETPAAAAPAGDGANPAAAGGKDESFGNWVDKLLKLKSTAYVADAEAPAAAEVRFEYTVRVAGKPEETVQVLQEGDAWYARSTFTRGLVKLSRTSVEDVAGEVKDIVEGRVPPEKPKATPPKAAGDAPPGLAPSGMMPKAPGPREPRAIDRKE